MSLERTTELKGRIGDLAIKADVQDTGEIVIRLQGQGCCLVIDSADRAAEVIALIQLMLDEAVRLGVVK